MEVNPIGDPGSSHQIESLSPPQKKKCLFIKGELCSAPKMRFDECETCHRIDPKHLLHNLYHKARQTVKNLFSLEVKENNVPKDGGRL